MSLIILLKLNMIDDLDNIFYNIIIKTKSETSTRIFLIVTELGGVVAIISLLLITFIVDGKKGLYLFLSLLIIMIINSLFKYIFARTRPEGINIVNESWYSFPSAHSMNSIALYGMFIYYLRKLQKSKKVKVIFTIILLLPCIFVPLSRVYLGVHFFSDILAGACISVIWLIIYTNYLNKRSIIA